MNTKANIPLTHSLEAESSIELIHGSPMTDEDRRELHTKINSGQSLPTLSRPEFLQRMTKDLSDVESTNSGSDDRPLADEIFDWLAQSYIEESTPTVRDHAWMALREFMDLPCPPDELLIFFRAFANAYVRLLEVRVEVASGQPKSAMPPSVSSSGNLDNMSLAFARINPLMLVARLNRCETLRESDPESMDLFDLHEFAGCTPPELASYLDLPAEQIIDQIEDCELDIWGPTGRHSV